MEIISNTTDFYLEKETAVAIGKFDGVHIGHRRLLEEILSLKRRGLAACVFTFDPAPAVLFGQSDGLDLTTREEKRLLFERMNIDILIEFPMRAETAAILPGEFVREILAKRMNTRFVAAGNDLSFGAGGRGGADLLRKLGPELGFRVKTIEKMCLEGREVSSTYLRSKVEEGDLVAAEKLMGMPYMVAGRVTEGKHIGRTLGFPTVNIIPGPDKLLPPAGVYYSSVRAGGRTYRAVSNVGCKPTVTSEGIIGIESYLYRFDREIYGEDIEVYLHAFRRPERQFEDREALKRQLKEDIVAGEKWRAF
ncbi:MAG: riboflavin biosynthesis protein RibF [Butyrivibrio sp.]|nr:riboflavin biosynthesis protein RibF [Acetatifactor muris]MCM1561304.1 riboflavin biosynthesis protein RibF [Butyrivibrio sp.]